ncbi:MAG TPA: DoxX family protein [Sulfuricaulis sp.]|nr:DoxX family protein [Sulfuricaulis sp.]
MNVTNRIAGLTAPVIRGLEFLSPLIDLGIRLWVANVFWKSGLTKIQSWDSTVMLFTYEYQVPLLSPAAAAVLATGTELIFPVLLVLGLGTRVSAAVLFVFNYIAVISYPELNEVGVKDHVYWGILLLVTLLHGPGKISIDHFIRRKWMG